MYKKVAALIFAVLASLTLNAEILIPMDITQTNHLKAYGIAFYALQNQIPVKWLLNYRGGSFLLNDASNISNACNIRGVSFETINSSAVGAIMTEIQASNMEAVVLEKEPAIAVYIPPNALPWDDAFALALDYAEIKYDRVWDGSYPSQ
jgi:hypothetical protein